MATIVTEPKIPAEAAQADYDNKFVEAAFQKIRFHASSISSHVTFQIVCMCRIGNELIDLENNKLLSKDVKKRLRSEFGFNDAKVSRLKKLARNELSERILTFGQDATSHLSSDMQKLAKFVELPMNRWEEALQAIDMTELNRDEVRSAVDAMLEGSPASGQSVGDKPEADAKARAKRRVVEQLARNCRRFTDKFKDSVVRELRDEKTDDADRKKAKEAIEKAINTLQELLIACESPTA